MISAHLSSYAEDIRFARSVTKSCDRRRFAPSFWGDALPWPRVTSRRRSSRTASLLCPPAYFTGSQRQSTVDAAKIAGLNVRYLVAEPTAAAVAYLWNSDRRDQTYLAVHVGGGTTDCSVVEQLTSDGKKSFIVLATAGDNALGGRDFLAVLMKLFHRKMRDGAMLEEALRQRCERAKVETTDGANFEVDDYEVTEEDYVVAYQPLFDSLRKVVVKACDAAAFPPDAIIFAGGSCRLPNFEQEIRKVFPEAEMLPMRNLPTAVAEGASIISSVWHGTAISSSKVLVADVLPRALGIATEGGCFSEMLPKNTKLPAQHTERYTARGMKTSISLHEGGEAVAGDNIFLGRFDIPTKVGDILDVTIKARHDRQIEVTAVVVDDDGKPITTDLSGVLKVIRESSCDENMEQLRECFQRRRGGG
ncbi:Hsp70 protein-domain-containing protein [Lasiosphaeria ovina]|uniref:Hsp70 protein-domain-containing protein n=1 Tax=Lasiosphaeria ovina TaxID=92902 RepID=A0AAE0MZ79_9PEZI|nr:Hsp70 protein-domain-containing protein [Lasiosphaeria ovina]